MGHIISHMIYSLTPIAGRTFTFKKSLPPVARRKTFPFTVTALNSANCNFFNTDIFRMIYSRNRRYIILNLSHDLFKFDAFKNENIKSEWIHSPREFVWTWNEPESLRFPSIIKKIEFLSMLWESFMVFILEYFQIERFDMISPILSGFINLVAQVYFESIKIPIMRVLHKLLKK